MEIVINTGSSLAIYEQIVSQIKNAIFNHELNACEALPSIRMLASRLEVSVITTKRAYEELEKENLIRSVAGKGFYVCETNTEYLKEKQYVLLEKKVAEILQECSKAGMTKQEILSMVEELVEE
ncbi:MAG: GntR family transcriptional regulator [Eubacterium sp.]|jgi:GntR family transcriptional regulator|nr:GntR family transcriptional regulator [Eubacterium sp.]